MRKTKLSGSAGRHGKVSMLFPMITTLEELRKVNKMVKETRDNLRREAVPFADDVKTGVMVEVPAAAFALRQLCQLIDFVSIGTNFRHDPSVINDAFFIALATSMPKDRCSRSGFIAEGTPRVPR